MKPASWRQAWLPAVPPNMYPRRSLTVPILSGIPPTQVDWLRVVLDEAHSIKNAATQTAKAAQALKAQRRWVVTGTPIQNSLQV